ncbi:MAG: cytidine/deoxycytidylate deaminase family protein [Patescibacteria group bacterium]
MSSPFRPSWDDYFMAIARIIATRATCDRARIGAVLVKNKRIISTGYNGAPPGLPECDGEEGHLMEEGHCIRTLHAEENTILQLAAIGGTSAEGATLYTTHTPCYHCAKKIIMVGIKRVVGAKVFTNTLPIEDAFKQAGVKIEMYTPDEQWTAKLNEMFSIPDAPPSNS